MELPSRDLKTGDEFRPTGDASETQKMRHILWKRINKPLVGMQMNINRLI